MADGPPGSRRIRHRKHIRRRRLLTIELGGAAVFCAIAVAVAVGISQAASSPACASVRAVPARSPGQISGQAARAASLAQTSREIGGQAASQTSGEATHYVLQPGDGNCSYPGLPAGQLYVALPPAEYGAAAACGSYLKVTGPDGSVRVEVVDQCPDCGSGHIDLSEAAFARLAPLSAGLVSVTYRTITDPPLPAPLSLRVKEGSSAYWLALLPIDAGNPVTRVQVSSPSNGWQDLAHASYNYWLAASGMGAGLFTVRITDSVGNEVTLTGITLAPGVVQSTGTLMYAAGASAPVAAAAPTSAAPTATPTKHRRARARPTASPTPTRTALGPAPGSDPAPVSPSPSC
jgi:expansin (peptidoglycan-binding protein)